MRFVMLAILSSLMPLLASVWLFLKGKCGFATVIISPLIGLFLYAIIIYGIVLVSDDM